MRSILCLFATFVFFQLASPAFAATDTAPATNKKAADRVQFETDQKAGVVRIVIDGKEVARIDATGFYVHGDVAYTGTITDGLPLHVSQDGGNAR